MENKEMDPSIDETEQVETEETVELDETDQFIQVLEKQIEQLTAEIAQLKRGAADVMNRNKQLETDKKYASSGLVRNLLVPISYFEGALKMQTEDEEFKNFLKGFEMIYNLLLEQLYNSGLKEISVNVDDTYDPRVHEVFEIVPSENEENQILEIVQKGYYFKERVLIPVKVKVSGRMKETEDVENTIEENEKIKVN